MGSRQPRPTDGEGGTRLITRDDGTTVGPVIDAVHDLPHLVTESLFDLDDGVWASLAADGAQPGLTDGNRLAKALTNNTHNQWAGRPPTAAEVRAQRTADEPPRTAHRRSFDAERQERARALDRERLAAVDDEAVELATAGIAYVLGLWRTVPDGGSLELEWPLPREFFDRARMAGLVPLQAR